MDVSRLHGRLAELVEGAGHGVVEAVLPAQLEQMLGVCLTPSLQRPTVLIGRIRKESKGDWHSIEPRYQSAVRMRNPPQGHRPRAAPDLDPQVPRQHLAILQTARLT
nr:hypothetical protein [Hyalangium gracile]